MKTQTHNSIEITTKKDEDLNNEEEENLIITNNNENFVNLDKNIIDNQKKNSFKYSFIFIFFILVLSFSITIIIIYIIFCIKSKSNFEVVYNDWDASYLNNRKYQNYLFKNGLEVMLIHDTKFDRDGGAIVIDYGFMDYPYSEGIASIATCLLNYIAMNDTKLDKLDDYYGKYAYGTGEYYINFRFDILNDGFKKFMNYFSLILNPQQISVDYEKYIDDIINEININYKYNLIYDINNREKHLIQYLVFGIQENNSDILLEGDSKSILKYDKKVLKAKVMSYIKKIIDPSRIKIVFFSKYKFLITSKYMKKFFQYLINKEKPKNNNINKKYGYKNKKFNTMQLLYFNSNYDKSNFIKIIYYIDNVKDESFDELYYKSHYFNYITDFLNEKKEGSLYYFLTNSSNHNIKLIDTEFNIELKSKIKFSVIIYLNCLDNINNIIYLTYQYIDKIIKDATLNNLQMERYKELYNKFYKDVKYNDKTFDTKELAKNNAEHLFKAKYNLKNFLYQNYVPWYDNEELIKNESYEYFKQIKPENSVIILALRDHDKNKITCNESCPFYLNCSYLKDEKNNKFTEYYNITYINYTFKFNCSYSEINENANITFIPNKYMSKYSESFLGLKEESNIEPLENKTIFYKFYFKRNEKFGLPKVYISLNLFHPYLRPLNDDKSQSKCYYFKINEIFFAIKRKINEALADAIRAGNEINMGQNENYFYINTFCYEDVAYIIMEKIKYIIYDLDWASTDFYSNNEIYKNEVFDDYFYYDKLDIEDISKYYFYCKVKNDLYNKYEFFPKDFEENLYFYCKDTLDEKELNNLKTFVINGFIYGYYTKKDAEKISDLFENNYKLDNFTHLLDNVNNSKLIRNSPEIFINWIKEIKELNVNDEVNISVKVYNRSDFDYFCNNYGISYIKFNELEDLNISLFSSILEKVGLVENLNSINLFVYKDIYFEFIFLDSNFSNIIPNNDIINETWNSTLDKLYIYNNYVDNIGNRYYYVKKNYLSSLYVEQNSLVNSATETINDYLYERTSLDAVQLYNNYIKKYKGKRFDKKELDYTIEYYSDILKRIRFDVYTID